jgi:hypothetical protein
MDQEPQNPDLSAGLEELEGNLEAEPAPTAGAGTERIARLFLGAGSGGVLGLVLSGLVGTAQESGEVSFWVMAGLVLILAAGMGWLSMRQTVPGKPAPPRAVWAGVLSAGALLLTEGVYMFQAGYIDTVTRSGEQIRMPLAVWPVSSKALGSAVILAAVGIILALLGWADAARERGKYSSGKWVAHAILAGGATLGLGLACYLMGNGVSFGV